jgi:DNA invertase Pin-like site-specific DNA recombinase
MSAKISEQHLQKPAYIYVRQSTIAQVRFHQESTERQYALRGKALELGWTDAAIRTLDRDLGVSGSQMAGREDFKSLVTDVSMGKVGAVFALEASRLARSSLDWHRLIELCALTGTLVIDEDGCYDPADFNDGLLLGLKGTLAQAELHFLRARLQGGRISKARKGELRFPLPVGLNYGDEGRIILDPDIEVQGAMRLIFSLFQETGSAYGVMQRFAQLGLRFPKRAYGGAWAGQLVWGPLTHSRILYILKNPSYAGAYVFGRYQSQRTVTPAGEVRTRFLPAAIDAWQVCLNDHHEAYITWEEFLRNQDMLAKNQTNGEAAPLGGPSREGLALLQGLLLCGGCGRRLTVRYCGNGGLYPTYECSWLRREGTGTKACMAIRCDLLDRAVAGRVLAVLQPAEIELALEALHNLEARDQAVMRQWQMRIERAEYEAQLAERRYQEVDPANRLVAATLERRWNEALQQLAEVKQQYAETERREARALTPGQKVQVLALAQDFPRLWNAPTTQAKDRKRMLRLLVQDITVERPHGARQALLHVRWHGGACADIAVPLPPPRADQIRYPPELVQNVRELACEFDNDGQIAECLNQQGILSATGQPFNASMVQWIRYSHGIPRATLRHPEELTVKQVAEHFGVSSHVVYYWIEHGILAARQLGPQKPYWVTLEPIKEQELWNWVDNSCRIQVQIEKHSKTPL